MEKLKHKVDKPYWFRLPNQMNSVELDGREVPHSCSDPQCPGDINRRKLEAAEEMARALKRAAAIDPNIMSPNLEAALLHWQKAGKGVGE